MLVSLVKGGENTVGIAMRAFAGQYATATCALTHNLSLLFCSLTCIPNLLVVYLRGGWGVSFCDTNNNTEQAVARRVSDRLQIHD